jgi:peptide/nickel transport system substrate-binding protein
MFDASGNPIPWLATEWEWVGEKTLRMKLREGVKFSNGELFDAQVAKYSLDILGLNAPQHATHIGDSYDRTEIIDDYTVDLHVKSKAGAWLSILARGSFVVPPQYVEEIGLEAFANQPIGTGPYIFSEWIRDDHITLDANMDYWGGPPPMDQLVFKVIPEEAARLAALETGEVDIITTISSSSVSRIVGSPEMVAVKSPGLRMFGTFFNEIDYESPLNNKTVRQALNYAVDKEGLVKLHGGFASVMTPQWLTPDTFGYNENLEPFPYDPEKAKELLAEAGYPDGFDIKFAYTVNRYPMDKEMGEAVASYLNAVGVRTEQTALEMAEFFRLRREGALGPLEQWGVLTPPDACLTLGSWSEQSTMRKFGSREGLEELIISGCEASDGTEQKEIYTRAIEILADDPFCIYLLIPDDIYGTRSNVVNFQPRIDQVLWLHEVYKTD